MPEAHLRSAACWRCSVATLTPPASCARRGRRSTIALLRYYGELFLGAAEEALGHYDAARDAYQQAAALVSRPRSRRGSR